MFPHHGGRPGHADPGAFAEALASAVSAELVIFSIGRGRYGTPRPEVVAAVLRGTNDAHIACTQLSKHCAADVPTVGSGMHLATSRGAASRLCCAGTVEVSLEAGERGYAPTRDEHIAFIRSSAPTALCQRRGSSE